MKLLIDQNISSKLIGKISDNFPEAKQVIQLGIESYSDLELLKFAKENDYAIVTFDADFYDLSKLSDFPLKIVFLRCSNLTSDLVANKINAKHCLIKDFIIAREYDEIACLEIK